MPSRTQADKVTSQSRSWKLSYWPIVHHSIEETNFFYWGSLSFPKCAWSFDWKPQPVHSSMGDTGWQPYVWWNTSSWTTKKSNCKNAYLHHLWLLKVYQNDQRLCLSKTRPWLCGVLHATTSTHLDNNQDVQLGKEFGKGPWNQCPTRQKSQQSKWDWGASKTIHNTKSLQWSSYHWNGLHKHDHDKRRWHWIGHAQVDTT